MKRILINATHSEEVRVALCKGNHLYDFDLENRTREQKKANIYKGHITRVEPSLEAVFVEYGSKRQGFLPIREIASNYLSGNPREENIRKLIKEGDELIVQVEKEERGNKGAALSTFISLAGRYLVLMPNNPKGGGISRQISGKLREDMKRMLGNMDLPKGMSIIIRTAGIGKTQEDLQHDLNHLLNIWNAIQEQNQKYPSPRLVHQEAGVVTRAVRDYLRDDISEIWIDNEDAFVEAETFVKAVMPKQVSKLHKYTEFEPMFSSFGVERQIETAYQREVRLPSGGSIVIDQTEALVSIDINSAKSTKGADVSETAFHTNLEAADEIARQLRLRDMGGLIVIDFIDMSDNKHQKEVEKRLVDATKYDRARVQFGDISRFGLLEMSRQRLRPSLEESTGYVCPRCHGTGMIRDLRSLSLSIMRQIEQTALKERHGEVQAEVPTDIAAFLLNEKRESLVYLEQDSGCRITILPHAHLESPNFNLHFNHQGFAPASYERVTDTQEQETTDRGYEVNWQTADNQRPDHQPTRQPRNKQADNAVVNNQQSGSHPANTPESTNTNTSNNDSRNSHSSRTTSSSRDNSSSRNANTQQDSQTRSSNQTTPMANQAQVNTQKPAAVAWLSNLFAQAPQAAMSASVSSADAASAIEAIVNTGAQSRGAFGDMSAAIAQPQATNLASTNNNSSTTESDNTSNRRSDDSDEEKRDNNRRRNARNNSRSNKNRKYDSKNRSRDDNTRSDNRSTSEHTAQSTATVEDTKQTGDCRQDETNSQDREQNRSSDRNDKRDIPKRAPNSRRESRGAVNRNEPRSSDSRTAASQSRRSESRGSDNRLNKAALDPNEISLQVCQAEPSHKEAEVVHISLDDAKPKTAAAPVTMEAAGNQATPMADVTTPVMPTSVTTETTTAQNSDTLEMTTSDASSDASQGGKKAEQTVDVVADAPNSPSAVSLQQPSAPVVASDVTTDPQTVTTAKASDDKVISDESTNTALASNEPTTGLNDSKDADLTTKAVFGFDTDALFADRNVAAKKYGQAKNDPRLIKASMAKLLASDATHKTGAELAPETLQRAATIAIKGTVGEFIHTHLANASLRLQKDGVIRCFLSALNAHKQTSGEVPVTDLTIAAVIPEPVFNFINYGYEPLSKNYLETFHTLTAPVAHVEAPQGKTYIAEPVAGPRAANDPRGQHPDYKAPEKSISKAEVTQSSGTEASHAVDANTSENNAGQLDVAVQASHLDGDLAQEVSTSTAAPVLTAAMKSPAEAMAELLALNVGEFVCRVLGEEGTALLEQGQTEAAFLQALRQPLDVLLSVAKTVDDKKDTACVDSEVSEDNRSAVDMTTASTSVETSVLDTDTTEDNLVDSVPEAAPTPAQMAEEASSNKTSIESYKSMIENISEQLLPQKGLLNLTSPKVPKARARKVKEDKVKEDSPKPASDTDKK